jgi:tetratricopeptide (TPR) repeat protein
MIQGKTVLTLVFFAFLLYGADLQGQSTLQIQLKMATPEHTSSGKAGERLATPEQVKAANLLLEEASDMVAKKNFVGAAAKFREVVATCVTIYGDQNPAVLVSRNSLAATLQEQKKYAEAENEYRTVLKECEQNLSSLNHVALESRRKLAEMLFEQRKYTEAEQEYYLLLTLQEKSPSPDIGGIIETKTHLAVALFDQGKFAEAEQMDRNIIESVKSERGPDDLFVAVCEINLAKTLRKAGKHNQADQAYASAVEVCEKTLSPEKLDALKLCYDELQSLAKEGDLHWALKFAELFEKGMKLKFGEEHPMISQAKQVREQIEAGIIKQKALQSKIKPNHGQE